MTTPSKIITVQLFDVNNPANLPAGVAVYSDGAQAFADVQKPGVDIALVNLEAVCAKHNLLPGKKENEFATINRWKAAMALEITLPVMDAGDRGYNAGLELHYDGVDMIAEMVRIHSSTLFCTPAISREVWKTPVPKAKDLREEQVAHGNIAKRWVVSGRAQLFCPPNGYGVLFKSEIVHSKPAQIIHAENGDCIELEGPHLAGLTSGLVFQGHLRAWQIA